MGVEVGVGVVGSGGLGFIVGDFLVEEGVDKVGRYCSDSGCFEVESGFIRHQGFFDSLSVEMFV